MKTPIMIILIMLGLVIFGCTQPDTTQPTGNTAANDSMEDTSGHGTMDETSDNGSMEDTSADTSDEGSGDMLDLSGMEYAALMALGIPLECDITTTTDGQTITQKMYADGQGNSRIESTDQAMSSGCSKWVVILQKEKMYWGCEGGNYPPGTDCDWMLFEQSENATSSQVDVDYGDGGGFDTDYSDVPPADIDCKPWVLDPSKFTPSGEICDMEDLMSGYAFG